MKLSDLQDHIDKKLISVKSVSAGDNVYSVACYTKTCFFGKDTWDDITKSQRGAIYYNGIQVNRPFDKIFNIDEIPETDSELIVERMKNEPYYLYDKANGHLLIVSIFYDEGGKERIVFSTKGSLPHEENDLLNQDIELFKEKYLDNLIEANNNIHISNYSRTYMFEAIVEHDKHTLYDKQVEEYGNNTFVLLSITFYDWKLGRSFGSMPYDLMTDIASKIECPIIKAYPWDDLDILSWKDHKEVEGYVIHFNESDDDFRVKIKTVEYWQQRFKKDLTVDKILSIFVKGEEAMKLKLPEEISEAVYCLLCKYFSRWYILHRVDINYLICHPKSGFYHNGELTPTKRKLIFTDESLNRDQKLFLVATSEGKNNNDIVDAGINKKQIRTDFVNYVNHFEKYYDAIKLDVEQLVSQL